MYLANSVAFSSTPEPLKTARLSVMSSVPGPLAAGPSGSGATPQFILASSARKAAPDRGLDHRHLAVEPDGAHLVLLVGGRTLLGVGHHRLVGLERRQHLGTVHHDVAVGVDDLAVVGVNPVQELVHRVVEGLRREPEARDAGLLLDLLGEGDLLVPGLRRRLRIEPGLLEEVLVPVERLGREGDRHAPLGAVGGHRVDDVGIVGRLLLVGHRHLDDQVVGRELLQRARADIGERRPACRRRRASSPCPGTAPSRRARAPPSSPGSRLPTRRCT